MRPRAVTLPHREPAYAPRPQSSPERCGAGSIIVTAPRLGSSQPSPSSELSACVLAKTAYGPGASATAVRLSGREVACRLPELESAAGVSAAQGRSAEISTAAPAEQRLRIGENLPRGAYLQGQCRR